MTEPTGSIYIDDVQVNAPGFGLADLRSNISIIPQDPVFLAGTVRHNLDPFAVHADDELWSVLRQVYIIYRNCICNI
jgi:ABC-type multidrug transport system fused ATPase/permease subunit